MDHAEASSSHQLAPQQAAHPKKPTREDPHLRCATARKGDHEAALAAANVALGDGATECGWLVHAWWSATLHAGRSLGVRKPPLCCQPGTPRRQERLTPARAGLGTQAAHRAKLRKAAKREIALLRDHTEGAEPALANEVSSLTRELVVHLAINESLLRLCKHVLWLWVVRWGRRVLRWRVDVWCR